MASATGRIALISLCDRWKESQPSKLKDVVVISNHSWFGPVTSLCATERRSKQRGIMRVYENWLGPAIETGRRKGLWPALFDLYFPPYVKFLHLVNDLVYEPLGEPIYEREWDLLVVLDACRVDLMAEVLDEGAHDFVDTISTTTSVGSMTRDWMTGNFTPEYAEEMAETVYVCGNPFSKVELDADWFEELTEVWRYGWDDASGTLPPRPITDEAIRQWNVMSGERMIVHYMQPHSPFLSAPELSPGKSLDSWPNTPDGDVWTRVAHGEFSQDTVWDRYRENLELVMDDVALLLENVDAERAIVTSDHGNGLGERGVYGHPGRIPFDSLRRVPWIEVTASDTGDFDPGTREATDTDSDIQKRLESLGYI